MSLTVNNKENEISLSAISPGSLVDINDRTRSISPIDLKRLNKLLKLSNPNLKKLPITTEDDLAGGVGGGNGCFAGGANDTLAATSDGVFRDLNNNLVRSLSKKESDELEEELGEINANSHVPTILTPTTCPSVGVESRQKTK
jgi:hypothetical protein